MTISAETPLRIRKVFIEGNDRTKAAVFEHELQGAYEAQTVYELHNELQHTAVDLVKLGIFKSVDVQMKPAVGGADDETDVVIRVKEKNWWTINIGANTDGYEGSAESSCTLLNPLGSAESFTALMSQGYAGSNVLRADYACPRFLGLPLFLNANASKETLVNETVSSYNEKYRGGSLSVRDYSGTHELKAILGWRDIIPRRNPEVPTAFSASRSIVAEAIPSLKTSLKYSYCDDTRNSQTLPTFGNLLRTSLEVSGLLGDVRFVKGETTIEKHMALGPMWNGHPLLSFGLSSRLGAIKNYGSDADRSTRISDRFFLGGPTSLRGFQHRGVGPRASPREGGSTLGDSLGGNVVYSALASMSFPLPLPVLAELGFRGQFFANAGNLTTWNSILDKNNWLRNMLNETRASVGVGMVLGTAMGRIEANYSWLLRFSEQDRVKYGQLGVSVSFS